MTATRRPDGSHRAAYGAHDGGRRRALAVMVAVLLLAAFLRFHDLDAQSFWNDEGNSARIIERTPALIVEAAAGDIHPPLYYLLLAGWRLPAGFSAFALRSFSVMCGLFTVALTFALGRRLFDRTVGVLGALVVALHAFQVYYSQEARMYALMAALAAGSMYAWVRWCAASAAPDAGGLNRWAAALVVLNAAGLYTQYAYPVVMLAQAVAFAAWWLWRSRRRRVIAVFAGLLLASVALYLPWLVVEARQALGWPTTGADESLLEAVQRMVALLVYGIDLETWGLGRAIWAAGIPLIVAALPLVLPRAFEPPRGRALHAPGWRLALLWAWALLPVAGGVRAGAVPARVSQDAVDRARAGRVARRVGVGGALSDEPPDGAGRPPLHGGAGGAVGRGAEPSLQ
ncbi:MAG: glycosyltransferase family 39 protein [Anaerolineae bacterium]|nr:glycosyltransferase family 39 protein [Anaerolineae bacterium]